MSLGRADAVRAVVDSRITKQRRQSGTDFLTEIGTGLDRIAPRLLRSAAVKVSVELVFVERDLVVPAMAQIVLLGANVGTAVTAWIVSTGIEWISPLLVLVGIVFYRRASTVAKGIGAATIGVGLMLLSLHLLSLATEPLRHSPALGAFIQLLDNAWVVAMLFSAILATLSSPASPSWC